MNKKIALLPGDGVGEEVINEAVKVLDAITQKYGHSFEYTKGYIGGAGYDKYGQHFPQETKDICENVDAILFGSVGGPVGGTEEKWKNCEVNSILSIRKMFNFNANFRPAKVYPFLSDLCPLKIEIVEKGIDILIIRELIGDIYFGEHKTYEENGKMIASDIAEYTEDQIRSIAKVGFEAAMKRNKKLHSVDKANVLDTSKLWRKIVEEESKGYPEVEFQSILVDNCAMQLITHPYNFDVVLCPNLFGDILSDETSVLVGSLGLMPSASFNEDGFGMYEPIGGSAPDIAGKNVANPIAQILSAGMMLKYSFGLDQESADLEGVVNDVLKEGYRTNDIYREGNILVGTKEMGDLIVDNIK